MKRCAICLGTGDDGDRRCTNCGGLGRMSSLHGNPPRALVRCWRCLEWIELPSSSSPEETRLDLGEDVHCTSCGALVASCRPHTMSIPERSLAL